MRINTIGIVVVLLLSATLLRFVSLAGFDAKLYGDVLKLYFGTNTRALFFLVQFTGVIYVLGRCIGQRPPTVKVVFIASVLMLLVSVVRHFVPSFLISLVGDLLVIAWVKRTTSKASSSRAA